MSFRLAAELNYSIFLLYLKYGVALEEPSIYETLYWFPKFGELNLLRYVAIIFLGVARHIELNFSLMLYGFLNPFH